MKKIIFSLGAFSLVVSPLLVVSCNDDSNPSDDNADINAALNDLKNTFGSKQVSKSTAQSLNTQLRNKNSGGESEFITIMNIEGFSFPRSINGTQIKWVYEGVNENGYKDNGTRYAIKFTISKPNSYAQSKQWTSYVESSDYLSNSPEDQLNAIFKIYDKDNFTASGNQTKTSATNMVNWFVKEKDFEDQLNYFGIQLDMTNENFNYILNGQNIRANESYRRVEGLTITITNKQDPTITRTTREFSISGYASLNEEDCYIVIDYLDDPLVFGSEIRSTKDTHSLDLIFAGTEPIAHGENGANVSSQLGLPTEIAEKLTTIELRKTTVTYIPTSVVGDSVGEKFIYKVKVAISGTEKSFNMTITGNDYVPL